MFAHVTRNHICLLIQNKIFALKKSLNPIGLIYSSNMGDSLLFTPPIWRTWRHVNTLYLFDKFLKVEFGHTTNMLSYLTVSFFSPLSDTYLLGYPFLFLFLTNVCIYCICKSPARWSSRLLEGMKLLLHKSTGSTFRQGKHRKKNS